MNQNPKVSIFGEALVDFFPDRCGVPLRRVDSFRKSIGGAPANVSVALARLGEQASLIGKVGTDEFGHYLMEELQREGVSVHDTVRQTDAAKTGITFVTLDADGDRSFLFFREPSADMTIRAEDIPGEAIANAAIFVYGSNLLTRADVRDATWHAITTAKNNAQYLITDPNIRLHLWDSEDEARKQVLESIKEAHVVKVNEEELKFLTGGVDGEALYRDVLQPAGGQALIVTLADRGAIAHFANGCARSLAPSVDVVDTTGAGDGFLGGLVAMICRASASAGSLEKSRVSQVIGAWSSHEWSVALGVGCYVGSAVCRKLGATSALPYRSDLPWRELIPESLSACFAYHNQI